MKKIITILIAVVFLLGIGFGIYQIKQNQRLKIENGRIQLEQARNKRIDEIKDSLSFFIEQKPVEQTDDPIVNYYNTILKNKIIIDEIDISKLQDLLTVSNISPKKLDESIAKISEMKITILPTVQSLEELISAKESYEQEVYLEIYQNSMVAQSEQEDLQKLQEYQDKLQDIENFFLFLKNNNKSYWIENDKIVYKTDSFFKEYQSYVEPLTLSFSISKELDLGMKIPILMYHGVLDNTWGDKNLFVRVSEFEQQMAYLKENGYTPIYVSEIKKAKQYEKPIIITFDDGYLDVYTNAYPILKKYGFKANAYVITNWLDGQTYMTKDMVVELASNGFEIGSHTLTHAILASLSEANIEKQLADSKKNLEELLGKEVTSIAYPTGSFDSRVLSKAKKYYNYGLSVIPSFEYENTLHTYSLHRLKVDRGLSISSFRYLIS